MFTLLYTYPSTVWVYRDAADQVRESVKQLNAEWADSKVSPCCSRDQLTGLVWLEP
jgi:hypothetical protein